MARRGPTGLLLASALCAIAAALGASAARSERAQDGRRAWEALLAADDTRVPDEPVLTEQLEEAIELRRREDYDRVLDARDPGELIEHATLSEKDFEHREGIDIETLFIVGDELFGYAFRPENGWGRGGDGRGVPSYTPRPRRVHAGDAGGPDAFACASCHFKGGPDGAGTQSQNAFFRGDGERPARADQRNAPHLLGLGPVARLAAEMSAALQGQAEAARARARAEGRRVEAPLVAKGVSFGRIAAEPDGTLDTRGVEGVDPDLTVRPFGWKGHQATLRGMAEESLLLHQGLVSNRVQFAVRDGAADAAAYGGGKWWDVDQDGVSLEIDDGMLSTMVGYLAQLEAPVVRPPTDPGLLDLWAAGRAEFDTIGCAHCHVPTLELDDPRLDARAPAVPGQTPYVIDVARDGERPKVEPRYARRDTSFLVQLFSDLKRHDMGEALATPGPHGAIPARVFLTRPLWGLADTAPYLHDGRAPTVHEAIALHGGEATAARDAYLALDARGRAAVRVFLASLTRAPKLFVP